MSYFYLIFCGLAAFFLPHLTHDSVDAVTQIMLQLLFILVGLWGAFTFWKHE